MDQNICFILIKLRRVLQNNKVEFKTELPEGSETKCKIQVQKETEDGMIDDSCDEESPKGYAGYCK